MMNIAVMIKTSAADDVRGRALGALAAEPDFCIYEIRAGESIKSGTDALVVFGGDGTMLEGAKAAARAGIPVIGVNLGRLGFLTQLDRDFDAARLKSLLTGGRRIKRRLLCVTAGDKRYFALNEALVRSACARPARLNMYVDGEFCDSYHSDGLIIATPTGSTAYSLSAGGPVLAPDVDATVVNPVCPHSLHSRPLVLSASSAIRVENASDTPVLLVVDGEEKAELIDCPVEVSASDRYAEFIDAGGHGFFKKLLDKMNDWGVTEEKCQEHRDK